MCVCVPLHMCAFVLICVPCPYVSMQGGCGVGRPFFHVTRCEDSVGGGFSTDYGVSRSSSSSNADSSSSSSRKQ